MRMPFEAWMNDIGESDPPLIHYAGRGRPAYIPPPSFYFTEINLGPSNCVWIVPALSPTGWHSRT